MLRPRPPFAHPIHSFDGLERADQHGVGNLRRPRHHIELVVQAINEIDVSDPARFEHRFGALCPAVAEGSDTGLVRKLHRAIAAVGAAIDGLQFNKAVAALYELVSAIEKANPSADRSAAIRTLLLLVAPDTDLPAGVGGAGDEVALKPLPADALVYRLQAMLIRTGRHMPTETGDWATDDAISSTPIWTSKVRSIGTRW